MKKNKKVALPTGKKKEPTKLPDSLGISVDIPFENLQSKSLFIATPCYGGMTTGIYTRCLIDLVAICKELKIPCNVHFLFNESLIPRGRNYCCDEFLRARVGSVPPEGQPDTRPYFSHMLFIDSDIGFDPKDVLLMLAISEPGSDKDIVCGPYAKKTIAWEKINTAVKMGFADENPNNLERFVGDFVFNAVQSGPIPLNQPIEVLESGTGYMLIQRQAFEKFMTAYPTQSYRPDHVRTKHFDGSREIFAFFDCPIDRGYYFEDIRRLMDRVANGEDVQNEMKELIEKEKTSSKRYLSEDYAFCQMIRRAGGKVWLIPWLKTTHMGSYMFGGSLTDLAAINVSATADPSQIKHR